jgi:hydrogenase-4 membrane subunit HyfE
MTTYILTLLCAATLLLSAFFAIRYRRVNAYVRLAAIAVAAAFILFLYFRFNDSSQLFGLGILAVALVFPLIDIKRHAKKQ